MTIKFWRSEVPVQFHWAEVKVSAGLVLLEALRGNASFFSASKGDLHSSAHDLFSSWYHSIFLLSLSHLPVTSTFWPLSFKDPCDSFALWIRQTPVPTSNPSQSHLQCSYHRMWCRYWFWGLGPGHLRRVLFSLPAVRDETRVTLGKKGRTGVGKWELPRTPFVVFCVPGLY